MSERAKIPVEHAGHWVDANIWFHLGLNKSEAAALKVAAERLLPPGRYRTSARAAHWLLRAALAHFNNMHLMIDRCVHYANAEGLDIDKYLASLACQSLDIAPKCERDGRTICSCRIEVEVAGQWRPYFEACRETGVRPLQDEGACFSEGAWMTARRAVSVLRRVQAQFPQHECRIHNDGVDHDSKELREGRQP